MRILILTAPLRMVDVERMSGQSSFGGSSRTRARAESRLAPSQQFWWGFLGGLLVLGFRTWVYVKSLPAGGPSPPADFRTCALCCLAIAFPFASGLVSRALGPHHRLNALFEGASAPAMFFLAARDFPL
jgi:hypothetical protein